MQASPIRSPGTTKLLRTLIRGFFAGAADVRVTGREHIPERGPCVLVFNHLSNFDAHLIFGCLERRDATGLAAAKYRARPAARWLIERTGGVWLDRQRGGHAAMRQALRLLEAGWLVGIAPEGRRSPTGALCTAKHGAAWLALRSGAPVLPVAITGTERLHRRIRRLRRTRLTVRFGPPLGFVARDRTDRVQRGAATESILASLSGLLPAAYRGVYDGRGAEPVGLAG